MYYIKYFHSVIIYDYLKKKIYLLNLSTIPSTLNKIDSPCVYLSARCKAVSSS